MNKKKLIALITVLAVIGIFATQKIIKKSDSEKKTSVSKVESVSYWTCPMHPQIHQDHEGECPICHMKLVKVSKQIQDQNAQGEKRSSVDATQNQLELIGIQKQEVERMGLFAVIPVSGRFISSSSVAFQVYEKDLKYVHSGLSFRGDS